MIKLVTRFALVLVVFHHVTVRADEPQPRLPTIVLVGDSIRLSYTPTVRDALTDAAVVESPKANCGDSSRVLANLKTWVLPHDPDIVHFNCGIHDTKRFKKSGQFQVPPEKYEQNLRDIVSLLREKTHAKLIFATSTPVLDDRAAKVRKDRDYELLNASIEQYNQIAKRVMQELDVPVNDLNAVANMNSPTELMSQDGVHFEAAGQKLLGEQVAKFLRDAMTSAD